MELTKETIGQFGYAFGVMATGALAYDILSDFTDPLLWVVIAVASAVWVVYYNRIMIPRFRYFRELRDDQ